MHFENNQLILKGKAITFTEQFDELKDWAVSSGGEIDDYSIAFIDEPFYGVLYKVSLSFYKGNFEKIRCYPHTYDHIFPDAEMNRYQRVEFLNETIRKSFFLNLPGSGCMGYDKKYCTFFSSGFLVNVGLSRDEDSVSVDVRPLIVDNLKLHFLAHSDEIIRKIVKETSDSKELAMKTLKQMANVHEEVMPLFIYWMYDRPIEHTFEGVSMQDIMTKEKCGVFEAIFSMSVLHKKPEFASLYKSRYSFARK